MVIVGIFSPVFSFTSFTVVGETGVGWDKFWLGQCPSVPNESPYGTDDVFGERMTTAFAGATCTFYE